MKSKICVFVLLALIAFTPALTCSTGTQTTAFKSISAAETAVYNANAAFLDAVVTGHAPTNSVPAIEASFNDVQMTLRLAATTAQGGAQAPVPTDVATKSQNFINLANSTRK